jgi:hypothetical protein
MTTKRTKAPAKAPAKAPEKAPEELYGSLLYKGAEKDRKGTPSEYIGHAFLKAPSDNRKGGIGKRILDFLLDGETYEELKARLKIAVREGTLDIPSIYIRNHLDYDIRYKNTSLVRYIEKGKGTVVNPVPEELKKAREDSGLPALDS